MAEEKDQQNENMKIATTILSGRINKGWNYLRQLKLLEIYHPKTILISEIISLFVTLNYSGRYLIGNGNRDLSQLSYITFF